MPILCQLRRYTYGVTLWYVLLESRRGQLRRILLQRLIDDQGAAAGLHGLELVGSDQLTDTAAAFSDDRRGLLDWDEDRLDLAHTI